MSGGVNHVEGVGLPINAPRQTHRLALDGDATFALNIHPVQVLGAHFPRLNDACQRKHAVGKRRLPMVDVSDNREVADTVLRRIARDVATELHIVHQ